MPFKSDLVSAVKLKTEISLTACRYPPKLLASGFTASILADQRVSDTFF